MKKEIPTQVIAVLSENMPEMETHASLGSLFSLSETLAMGRIQFVATGATRPYADLRIWGQSANSCRSLNVLVRGDLPDDPAIAHMATDGIERPRYLVS